jgi:uncharacterized membrane protein YeaQ/YmgE (transglycosylase-associated protein family)
MVIALALTLGLLVGVLGRAVVRRGRTVPAWLTITVGVLASLAATSVAWILAVWITPLVYLAIISAAAGPWLFLEARGFTPPPGADLRPGLGRDRER